MLKKTISMQCPKCGYVRHDLIHINNECGGLLLIDEFGSINCGLCGDSFNEPFEVTCPSCGYCRIVEVTNLFTVAEYRIVRMEIFETLVF